MPSGARRLYNLLTMAAGRARCVGLPSAMCENRAGGRARASNFRETPDGHAGMNYLAHFALVGDDPDALVGQWLGDFVKGSAWRELPGSWGRGVILHRALDRYTDSHPAVQRSCMRISPRWRRFRGVLIDLFFDHLLARRFGYWMGEELTAFNRRVCEILVTASPGMPDHAAQVARRMCANGWLLAYSERDSIAAALAGIDRRLRKQVGLAAAIAELDLLERSLDTDFDAFFPAVRAALPELEKEVLSELRKKPGRCR